MEDAGDEPRPEPRPVPAAFALRRRLLMRIAPATALGTVLVATGCADWSVGEPARIVEVASGRELTRAELLAAARASDFALLGELHDNPAHHALRGAFIEALGNGMAVVAEQLPRGPVVDLRGDLERALVDAGFDARGWDWPLHEPLFAAIRRAGAVLLGGNLPREQVRRIAREGASAVPDEARALIDAAPLGEAARRELEEDLVEGHCGHLPASRVANTVRAQRARDASMALALVEAAGRPGAPRPAVLVAGNGHVRTDYGVPQLLARARPGARVLEVGFAEHGATVAGAPYSHLWITRRVSRSDPCAAMPRATTPASA